MTQDEIIEMARQAGARAWQNQNCYVEFLCNLEQLEAFAKLVAEREREACALIGDGYHDEEANCGDLIRARGN